MQCTMETGKFMVYYVHEVAVAVSPSHPAMLAWLVCLLIVGLHGGDREPCTCHAFKLLCVAGRTLIMPPASCIYLQYAVEIELA